MPAEHYENFPVASWLCPAPYRAPIMAIYRFARLSDDLADEGHVAAADRLKGLAQVRSQLQSALQGSQSPHALQGLIPEVVAVAQAAHRHGLPPSLLFDLLSAFEQDCVKQRYENDSELMDYCRLSANPVGRLLLALWGLSGQARLQAWSDAICTGLQLINHWQDLGRDAPRGRLYLPRDDMRRARVQEDDVLAGHWSPALGTLLRKKVSAAMQMLVSGAPLASHVAWHAGLRLGLELRLVVAGGLRIGARLLQEGCNPFASRPHISWRDSPALLGLAMWPRGAV